MVLPRRVAVAPAIAVLTLAIAACGGTAPGQDGGGDGSSAAPSIARSYTIKAGDTTPIALAAGTYRLAWTTTGCTSVNIALNGDNGFTNERASRNPNFARIITSVPDGTYTVTQLETSCADWTATIDKIG
jgi:hypothetical protein